MLILKFLEYQCMWICNVDNNSHWHLNKTEKKQITSHKYNKQNNVILRWWNYKI